MRAFWLVGFFLLILLLGWIGTTVLFQTGYQKLPAFLGLGSSFEGSLQLPAEKITAAFEAARSRMLAVNDRGTEFRIVGDVAGWLSTQNMPFKTRRSSTRGTPRGLLGSSAAPPSTQTPSVRSDP